MWRLSFLGVWDWSGYLGSGSLRSFCQSFVSYRCLTETAARLVFVFHYTVVKVQKHLSVLNWTSRLDTSPSIPIIHHLTNLTCLTSWRIGKSTHPENEQEYRLFCTGSWQPRICPETSWKSATQTRLRRQHRWPNPAWALALVPTSRNGGGCMASLWWWWFWWLCCRCMFLIFLCSLSSSFVKWRAQVSSRSG